MNEIIQIKCPFDGAVLSVRNQPNIETKNVTCPICKNKYLFSQFKRVYSRSNTTISAVEFPAIDEAGYHTEINDLPNYTIGVIKMIGSDETYQLRPGRNVIGRKGLKSVADIQIDTLENRSMSREHLVIDVKKIESKGFVHYLSLYKQKVNETTVGGNIVLYGDCIILNHGDEIKLPDTTLKFVIPDGEETAI